MKEETKTYPRHTVGDRIDRNVPVVKMNDTVKDAEHAIRADIDGYDTINYLYVVEHGALKGALSIKELFRSGQEIRFRDIMRTNLVTVRPHTTKERAAVLAVKAGLKAVPVVDKNGTFLGVFPSDAIQQAIQHDGIEDALIQAGIIKHPEEAVANILIKATPKTHFLRRFPWLLIGLFGGLLSAGVVNLYEHALLEEILLASFIPLVVYLADAAGSQTQTLYIRSVVLDSKFDMKTYLHREVRVIGMLALALAFTVGLIGLAAWSSPVIGVTLFIAILLTMCVSATVAIFLPWFFMKHKIDPAVASGPFATLVRDISNLFIYFTVASLVLRYFA